MPLAEIGFCSELQVNTYDPISKLTDLKGELCHFCAPVNIVVDFK